ncbi:predicted protein [Phaeodactylum tricornutum CCAP 1055/1]|jgi:hypothetical protein|uniref:HIG1 domain-containing protein n=3 Tax=Phaeodactylum tricornutum TaxID=2850 RepID=B7GBA7_PHATC|nr:predicted protein [Phaeodactylum tricornutum CCAP 1055/1]EEC44183.1 predicted protein [Phaeodactylum tricornutum CCAP 1055/1]|eukprot:XP_002184434.1 predicted protein [Phaeodactylum tricornutum CCAP 1055/1]
MGLLWYPTVARCSEQVGSSHNEHEVHNASIDAEGYAVRAIGDPPKAGRVESFEEKAWRKFRNQPLVPIGCIATVYFLMSGLKSFQKQDPVNSQRMMKFRVMGQFATLVCFIGYAGLENFDWRLAPLYQDIKKVETSYNEEEKKEHQEGLVGEKK